MKRHERVLWEARQPMTVLMDARCLMRGFTVEARVPEYTWRLRKLGWSLELFSVGPFPFPDMRLRLCNYQALTLLGRDELRDMVRYEGLPSDRVICRDIKLASYVNGSVFNGWSRFFKDSEV